MDNTVRMPKPGKGASLMRDITDRIQSKLGRPVVVTPGFAFMMGYIYQQIEDSINLPDEAIAERFAALFAIMYEQQSDNEE